MADRLLSESLSLAQECSRQMRTISHLLLPPLLDELGLESALRWHADRGKGMAGSTSRNDSHAPFGIGIVGMEERVRQLRGKLAIESGPGGTVVGAVLPLTLSEEGASEQDPGLTG